MQGKRFDLNDIWDKKIFFEKRFPIKILESKRVRELDSETIYFNIILKSIMILNFNVFSHRV